MESYCLFYKLFVFADASFSEKVMFLRKFLVFQGSSTTYAGILQLLRQLISAASDESNDRASLSPAPGDSGAIALQLNRFTEKLKKKGIDFDHEVQIKPVAVDDLFISDTLAADDVIALIKTPRKII